jgi:hypothetical protein
MLSTIFDIATHDPINPSLIIDVERLFESHGMVNCGRLFNPTEIDSDEYIVDPEDFSIRELYDRRLPKTHYFSVFNVMRACPIPTMGIISNAMNNEDEDEFFSFMPEMVKRRNRSLIVQMKLRPVQFVI